MRIKALFLSIVLIFALSAPAFAVSEDNLYLANGPWSEWTEEQHASAEEWDYETWMLYWDAYWDAAMALEDAYFNEYDQWAEEYYGGWDDDSSSSDAWEEFLISYRSMLGMPYLTGINLSINGEYQNYGDLQPIAVSNRTMVPLRPFLESLGATVSYENGIILATMENGDVMRMELESTALTITSGEESKVIDMDVTPYILNQRTYIPVRFAAESVGMSVTWDDFLGVAQLVDWTSFIAEVDSHFTSMNAILAASLAQAQEQATYKITTDVSLDLMLYGETKNEVSSISGKAAGISDGTSASIDLVYDTDFEAMKNTMGSFLPAEAVEALEMLNGVKLSVRTDGSALYVSSPILSDALLGVVSESDWLCMDLGSDETTELQTMLTQEDLTIGSLLAAISSDYDDAQTAATGMRLLFDDSYFTVKQSGTTSTYTAKFSLVTAVKLAVELGLFDDATLSSLMGDSELPEFSYQLSAVVSNGMLTKTTMDGSFKMPDSNLFKFTFSSEETQSGSNMNFSLIGAYVGRIDVSATSRMSKTTESVPAMPSNAIDFEQALEDYYDIYYGSYYSDYAY